MVFGPDADQSKTFSLPHLPDVAVCGSRHADDHANVATGWVPRLSRGICSPAPCSRYSMAVGSPPAGVYGNTGICARLQARRLRRVGARTWRTTAFRLGASSARRSPPRVARSRIEPDASPQFRQVTCVTEAADILQNIVDASSSSIRWGVTAPAPFGACRA